MTLPALPAGVDFDGLSSQFIPCPLGSYRNSSMTGFTPCTFCPVGTFTSISGSTSCAPCSAEAYCTTGSVYPFSVGVIHQPSAPYLPAFVAEGRSQAYEEVLIHSVIGRNDSSLIFLYAFTGWTLLFLLLAVLPCTAQSRPITRFVAYVSWLYGRFKISNDTFEEHHRALEVNIVEERLLELEQTSPGDFLLSPRYAAGPWRPHLPPTPPPPSPMSPRSSRSLHSPSYHHIPMAKGVSKLYRHPTCCGLFWPVWERPAQRSSRHSPRRRKKSDECRSWYTHREREVAKRLFCPLHPSHLHSLLCCGVVCGRWSCRRRWSRTTSSAFLHHRTPLLSHLGCGVHRSIPPKLSGHRR